MAEFCRDLPAELRAAGTSLDQTKLAPPPSEIRQALKRQSLEGNWNGVLETGETAMGMECALSAAKFQK